MTQQHEPRPRFDSSQVEYHYAQARAMQSRELARLTRRLFTLPARLLGRTRDSAQARDARREVTGTSKA